MLLNAATPTELASGCPAASAVFPVDGSFLEADPAAAKRLAAVPRDRDWVVDDTRRHQPFQLDLFPGMRDHYTASDAHLRPRTGRSVVGAARVGSPPHQPVRLDLPAAARAAAPRRVGDDARPRIAVLPAGSSEPSLYPSVASWLLVLDALTDAVPGLQLVLLGRLTRDQRSSTSWGRDDVDALRAHRSRPVDCVDVPLAELLAVVEACDVLLAPTPASGWPRSPSEHRGWRSRAGAASSTGPTPACRSGRCCPTRPGTRRSASSTRRPSSSTGTTARGRRA